MGKRNIADMCWGCLELTVPPYVDTLFLVTLALIGREDDKAETSAAESAAASGS